MADLLIVDDDSDAADLLAVVLGAETHEVRIARDGQEGLKLLAEKTPDLVLLDVEMPLLSGPEMAYVMFVHDCGDEKVPIVLISGVPNLPLVAATVGTPYFLAKPYTIDEVLRLVATALGEQRSPHPARP